jgi:hypothetical protein
MFMNLLSYYINFIFSQKKTQILVLILGQLFILLIVKFVIKRIVKKCR